MLAVLVFQSLQRLVIQSRYVLHRHFLLFHVLERNQLHGLYNNENNNNNNNNNNITNHCRRQLWGTGARAPQRLPNVIFSGHFRAAQTLTLDFMRFPIFRKNNQAHRFVSVHCMNFTIFSCETLKLFSLSFMSLLTPNPGNATVTNCAKNYWLPVPERIMFT